MDECIHGLGPVSACTVCNGREERERAEASERPSVLAARYAGQCSACDLPIVVGQLVAWRPVPFLLVHEECAP